MCYIVADAGAYLGNNLRLALLVIGVIAPNPDRMEKLRATIEQQLEYHELERVSCLLPDESSRFSRFAGAHSGI